MNRNSVAQLISRARINLRDGLRQTALGSVASASPLCDRALPLLAMRQDGVPGNDAGWLAQHLVGCGTCRVRLDAMEEAGVAYRLSAPFAAAAWLRDAAIAHAAEHAGSQWRPSRGRGVRAAAGAGVATLIVIVLGLLAAEAHTPTRVFDEVAVPASPEPVVRHARWTPGSKVRPRRAKLHRVSRPAPAATPAPAPAAPVLTASDPAEPVARRPRRARKAPSHEAAVAEPAVTPEPTPEPTVTPDPPPPPPEDEPDRRPPAAELPRLDRHRRSSRAPPGPAGSRRPRSSRFRRPCSRALADARVMRLDDGRTEEGGLRGGRGRCPSATAVVAAVAAPRRARRRARRSGRRLAQRLRLPPRQRRRHVRAARGAPLSRRRVRAPGSANPYDFAPGAPLFATGVYTLVGDVSPVAARLGLAVAGTLGVLVVYLLGGASRARGPAWSRPPSRDLPAGALLQLAAGR